MRQIICEEKECYLEPQGGQNTYMMAGEQDGLTPTEATYMVPLKGSAQSAIKRGRKRRSKVQVGGKKPRVQKKRRKKPTKRLSVSWQVKGKKKKKKQAVVRRRKRS